MATSTYNDALSAFLINMDVYNRKRKVFAYLAYKYFIKRNRRRHWVQPYIGARLLKGAFHTMFIELREDEHKFFNYFCMNMSSFDELSAKLNDHIKGEDTNMRLAIPPTEMLAVTIRYLGSGCNLVDLHHTYRIGKSTISCIVRKVCKAICIHLKEECFPAFSADKWLQISEDFLKDANFPNCLGAIDSKHVRIKQEKSGSMCFNYKKFYSVVLCGIVDTNYLFNYVDVETAGEESDNYVFEKSSFYRKMINGEFYIPRNQPLPGTITPTLPFVFLGDEAFGLSQHIMRPFSGNTLNDDKRIFNYRLARGQRYIECAFGLLTNKWRIFHKPLNVNVDFAVEIIKCCCTLHNFVRRREGYEMEDLLTINGLYEIENPPSRQGGLSINQIRNGFTQYFLSDIGKLPWQDKEGLRNAY